MPEKVSDNLDSQTTFNSFRFGRNTKVIHFIGPVKPWQYGYDVKRGEVVVDETSIHSSTFLQLWWNIFIDKIKADLEVAYEVVIIILIILPVYQC